MAGLPETLKDDFEKVDRLEGQYRVTGFFTEELEDLSPGSSCWFCNVDHVTSALTQFVEDYKPMTTLSKVILSD